MALITKSSAYNLVYSSRIQKEVHRFYSSAIQYRNNIVSTVQIIAYEQIREDKYRNIKNAMFFVENKSTV